MNTLNYYKKKWIGILLLFCLSPTSNTYNFIDYTIEMTATDSTAAILPVCSPEVTAFAIQASCSNGMPNNDAYLQLSAADMGTHYNWSTGNTYTESTEIINATAFNPLTDLPLQFGTLNNPSGSRTYTIRVFNGNDVCYTDIVVTLNEQDCSLGCDCKEQIYLNDTGVEHIEKFTINNDSTLTELGRPWLDAGNVGLNNPHGIAIDNNGYLYIMDLDDQDIMKLDCNGNILDSQFIDFNQDGYNYFSIGNNLYLLGGNNGEVQVYDLCTGNQTHCISHWGGWGNTLGADGLGYSSKGYNGSGNSIHSFVTDTSLYATDLMSCPWNSTEVVSETPLNTSTPNSSFTRPMGITFDGQGNLYVVLNEGNFAGCARIQKYDANFNFVAQTAWDCDDTDGGWAGALGLIWGKTSNLLYISANDDCIAVFDTSLTNIPALNVPFPPTSGFSLAKAIGKVEECCPTNNNMTIDTMLCATSIGTMISLQDLINCTGAICEGFWTASGSNSGLTYNDCNNSVTINAQNACGTFTLESDGTGKYAQCGAFKITVNISVGNITAPILSGNQTVCSGGDPATFAVTTPASGSATISYQWQSTTDTLLDYIAIENATNAVYNPPSGIADTTHYRVIVTVENCSTKNCQDTSNVLIVTVLPCDYGDLPDISASTNSSDYQTLSANNGPIHIIDTDLTLGTLIDAELDGQQSMNAAGDGVDEDGLTMPTSLNIVPGGTFRLPLSVKNNTGNTAHLEAWIDWNGDGVLSILTEMEVDLSVNSGGAFPDYLAITVPDDAKQNSALGFRIRLSTANNMTPYGLINDGEVEDYLLTIACPQETCLSAEIEVIRN